MFHFPSIETHVTLPPDERHSAIIAFSWRPGRSAAALLRMLESSQGITFPLKHWLSLFAQRSL